MKKTNIQFYSELVHKADDLIKDFDTISQDDFYDRSLDLLAEFHHENTIILDDTSVVLESSKESTEFFFILSIYNLISQLVKNSSNQKEELSSFVFELLRKLKDSEYYYSWLYCLKL